MRSPAKILHSVPLLALIILLSLPGQVAASYFDLLGAGSRNAALGNTGTASSMDYSAVYYNPAAMVLGSSTIGAGVTLMLSDLAIRLADRPAGYHVPDLGPNGPAIGSDYRIRDLSDFEGFHPAMALHIGATSDLGLEYLRLGFIALVPVMTSGAQMSIYNNEMEQYFTNQLHYELLGPRIDHAVIMMAAAYKVADWLSLGLGLSFMPAVNTDNYVYLDNVTDMSQSEINVDLGLSSNFRPTAGLLLTPVPTLDIGFSFRDHQFMAINGTTEIQARGLQGGEDFPFFQDLDLTLQYSPRQLVSGLSWRWNKLSLQADLNYSFWSAYPDNHGETAGFHNTLSPRLGTEVMISSWDWIELFGEHVIRFGSSFEPSPVGPQTGRTNYVDNDRIVTSMGWGFKVGSGESALDIDLYVQVHALLPRSEIKETLSEYPVCGPEVESLCDEVADDAINPDTGEIWPESLGLQTGNPGFPGYSSGGWITTGGMEVSWNF